MIQVNDGTQEITMISRLRSQFHDELLRKTVYKKNVNEDFIRTRHYVGSKYQDLVKTNPDASSTSAQLSRDDAEKASNSGVVFCSQNSIWIHHAALDV